MTPLAAARSIWLTALRNASLAAPWSPPAKASWKRRMAVFIRDFTIRFRSVRRAVTRTRFAADRVLGTWQTSLLFQVASSILPQHPPEGYRRVRAVAESHGGGWGRGRDVPSRPVGAEVRDPDGPGPGGAGSRRPARGPAGNSRRRGGPGGRAHRARLAGDHRHRRGQPRHGKNAGPLHDHRGRRAAAAGPRRAGGDGGPHRQGDPRLSPGAGRPAGRPD